MKKFNFRLQTVLEGRQRVEDQAKIAFGQAQRRVIETEQEIADLMTRRTQTLHLSPDSEIQARVAAHQYADALTRKAIEAGVRRDEFARVAEMRRGELSRAQSDRRAVEKLRERAWTDYQTEMQRVEQNMLDEVASTRHEFARRAAAEQYTQSEKIQP